MVATARTSRLVWALAIFMGTVAAVALLLTAGFVLFAWLGLVHHHALPLEERLSSATVALSAKWHAGDRQNPIPETAATLAIGQTAFRTCVQCHGAQGDGQGELGTSVFPPVANLLSSNTKQMTDAQLFWIIKNGLSFTAMPAYETQFRDDAIWATVSYVRALQQGRAITFGAPPTTPPEQQGAGAQAVQRSPLVITDSGLQPATVTARPGIVELDVSNQGARGHQLVVSGAGKVPFNAGRLLPTQSLRLQGTLDAGDYLVAVDPGGSTPGPVITLTVR